MAAATTIALVAGAVISAGSAVYSGVQQNKAAKKQAALENQQAQMEQDAARREADNIRDQARRVKSAQRAALAGSGVKLDDQGSGAAILDETDRLAEQDALAVLKEGANRSSLLQGQASITKGRGKAAVVAGGMNAAASLVGGVKDYKSATSGSKTALQMDSDAQGLAKRSQPKYSLLGETKNSPVWKSWQP